MAAVTGAARGTREGHGGDTVTNPGRWHRGLGGSRGHRDRPGDTGLRGRGLVWVWAWLCGMGVVQSTRSGLWAGRAALWAWPAAPRACAVRLARRAAAMSPRNGRRTGAHRAHSLARQLKTKRRRRDLDEIHADLKPENAARLLRQEIDPDLPGCAQFYCLHCACVPRGPEGPGRRGGSSPGVVLGVPGGSRGDGRAVLVPEVPGRWDGAVLTLGGSLGEGGSVLGVSVPSEGLPWSRGGPSEEGCDPWGISCPGLRRTLALVRSVSCSQGDPWTLPSPPAVSGSP